jgi:hypothetical protein
MVKRGYLQQEKQDRLDKVTHLNRFKSSKFIKLSIPSLAEAEKRIFCLTNSTATFLFFEYKSDNCESYHRQLSKFATRYYKNNPTKKKLPETNIHQQGHIYFAFVDLITHPAGLDYQG